MPETRPHSPEHPTSLAQQRGAVMVLVMVMLVFLVALVFRLHVGVRDRMTRADQALQDARLRSALLTGVEQAMQLLADDEDLQVDHLGEDWAHPLRYRDPAGIAIQVQLSDASARFDLNNIFSEFPGPATRPASDLLSDLFASGGHPLPQSAFNALRDWVDPDNEGSFEARHYADADLEYAPPNRPLQTRQELSHIPGFSLELPPALAAAVGVLPVSRKRPLTVNVNTAPRPVLQAILGMQQQALLDTLMASRSQQPLRNRELIAQYAPPQSAEAVRSYLHVRSSYFRVRAQASLPGQRRQLQALLHRGEGGHVEVIQWVM